MRIIRIVMAPVLYSLLLLSQSPKVWIFIGKHTAEPSTDALSEAEYFATHAIGKRHKRSKKIMVKDPVCGRTITEQQSVGKYPYAGLTYYFCQTICRELFEQNPQHYTSPSMVAQIHETGGRGV